MSYFFGNINEGADILMSSDALSFFTVILQDSYLPTMRNGVISPNKIKQKIRYSLARLSPEYREEIECFQFNDQEASRLVEEGLSDLTDEDFIIRA